MAMLPKGTRSGIGAWWLVHTVLFVLVTIMWSPALFRGKSIIQGDSLVFSLPLLKFMKDFLHGGPSPLWVGQIYGGHPLFAEGQGAFLEPLNLLIAWALPPVLGSNVFHYLCMLLAGAGMIRLCKELGSSAWSAGFAGLTVVFSACWIFAQNNMAISGALLWAPWVLVAFERWLKSPTMVRALWLSIAGSMLMFAGYPQTMHGVVLFALGTLVVLPFTDAGRQLWRQHRGALLGTGVVAIVLCAGLSAIQALPTLELAMWSHRNGGVKLINNEYGAGSYLRGMLFSLDSQNQITSVGSLFACMLACLSPVLRAPSRGLGYLFATLLMLVLSLGPISWLFRVIYAGNLIPGLHFFRILQIYAALLVVGIAVLAAFSIDALRGWLHDHPDLRTWGWPRCAALIAFMSCGIIVACASHPARGLWQMLAIVVTASFVTVGLGLRRQSDWIPIAMFALVVMQCAGLDLHSIRFYDAPSLDMPSALDTLPEQDPRDRKLFMSSIAIVYAMLDPKWPHLDRFSQRALASGAGLSNLFKGAWSLDGALALQLRNRKLLDEPIGDEIAGHAKAAPGARLIDLLAVHYIVADSPVAGPGFRVFAHDNPNNFWVIENTLARPFLQIYKDAAVVDSADNALDRLRAGQAPHLILQQDPKGASLPLADATPGDTSDAHATFVQEQSDYYAIDVQSPFACWLYLADANYAGWYARVDGKPATVWTAQLLGKAVHVPSGTHRVIVAFRSESFILGRMISLLSLLVVAGILIVSGSRHRQERRLPA